MTKEERELLIDLLQSCLEKIIQEHGPTKYFAVLMALCVPNASTFVLGKNAKATLRWLFRAAPIDAHVEAIWIIANEER